MKLFEDEHVERFLAALELLARALDRISRRKESPE